MKADKKEIYCVEIPTGTKAYFHYDREHGVVEYNGKSVTIPDEKFMDFIHVAGMLGLGTGKI